MNRLLFSTLKQSAKLNLLTNMDTYFNQNLQKQISKSDYNVFSIISNEDHHRLKFSPILQDIIRTRPARIHQQLQLSLRENRSIACFLALAVCDALGASTQLIPFVKSRRNFIDYDFLDIVKQVEKGVLKARSGRIGVWTDDCSMALCMADSFLLLKNKFDPIHMRYLFHMWWNHGLNNGGRRVSMGLGTNISTSVKDFTQNQTEYAKQGDRFDNGNGSLMRLAPIPLNYLHDQNAAMDICGKSSNTTHNGDESKQCSKLMGLILVRLINRKENQNWREVIQSTCQHFAKNICEVETVKYLALSQQQPQELYNQQAKQYDKKFTKFNESIEDRDWNWKDKDFTYSSSRMKIQPHYVGSYCMDALAMALHTVWYSNSFQELALINANMGGDCDSVGAIAGQIGGAIYGIDQYMMHLYSQMEDSTSGRFEVFLKAYKLVNQKKHQLV